MEVSAPVAPVSAEAPAPTAATPGESPAQTQARMFKVKVNGQEKEIPEDVMIRDYQTREAADKRFQEAAEMKKSAESFMQRLKSNPIEALKDPSLGHDVRKLAEEYLVAQIQEEMMDPKDRELRDLKKYKEGKDAEEMTAKEQAEAERKEVLRTQYADEYQEGIIQALETSGLPRTPFTVRKMAYYMAEGLKRELNLSPKDVLPLVKEDYMEEHKHFFSALDGESLIDFVGKENADKLRKHDLARLKRPGLTTPPRSKSVPRMAQPEKTMSRTEWREMQRERAGKSS